MIQIAPQMRILLAVDPVDFRSGIDRLCSVCRHRLQKDPLSGCLFVFTNRKRTAIRILAYDGQGFWLCHKRLSQGRFRWWPEGKVSTALAAHELQVLLWNGDPRNSKVPSPWREISTGH
jgi:transposase